MSQHTVSIEVAGRRLKIACPHGQESALLQAAKDVNARLEQGSKNGRSVKTPEQAMLLVALNLANENINQQLAFEQEKEKLESKINLLQQTIEQAVSKKQA